MDLEDTIEATDNADAMDEDPPPLQEDALLAQQQSQARALLAHARQTKLQTIAAANKKLGDNYVHSFFRDGLFTTSPAAKALSSRVLWKSTPSLTCYLSRPGKEGFDP